MPRRRAGGSRFLASLGMTNQKDNSKKNKTLQLQSNFEQLAANRIQNAVQKMNALGCGVAAGDLQRLIDDDRSRGLWVAHHLRHGGAQQVAIDDRHALQPPVLCVLLDQGIDLVLALGGEAMEIVG